MELILSPDLHLTLYLGMDIDESKMFEKLGDAFHVELVMVTVRGIDRTCFGGLSVSLKSMRKNED